MARDQFDLQKPERQDSPKRERRRSRSPSVRGTSSSKDAEDDDEDGDRGGPGNVGLRLKVVRLLPTDDGDDAAE